MLVAEAEAMVKEEPGLERREKVDTPGIILICFIPRLLMPVSQSMMMMIL